jgi:NAD(P)-dependent dehydrogenase (short-subunit alcohol dehydrogenase family)
MSLDPVGSLEKDLWDRIIAVNLTAPMMVTKLGVNHMLEKQIKGSIINIGSVAALRGFAAGKSAFCEDLIRYNADTLFRRCRIYLIQAWSCRLDEKHSCILHGKGHPV